MNDNKIGVRYAKALFQLGQERNILDSLRTDIEIIASTCSESDMLLLLESPVVKSSKKQDVFVKIFKGNVQDLSIDFLSMIIENKRENYIPAICRNFIDQYRKHKGIRAAKVTTAVVIDDNLKKEISKVISNVFKTDVELSTHEDGNLIGGFILRVGDQQIDASVSTKLSKIKREFLDKTI